MVGCHVVRSGGLTSADEPQFSSAWRMSDAASARGQRLQHPPRSASTGVRGRGRAPRARSTATSRASSPPSSFVVAIVMRASRIHDATRSPTGTTAERPPVAQDDVLAVRRVCRRLRAASTDDPRLTVVFAHGRNRWSEPSALLHVPPSTSGVDGQITEWMRATRALPLDAAPGRLPGPAHRRPAPLVRRQGRPSGSQRYAGAWRSSAGDRRGGVRRAELDGPGPVLGSPPPCSALSAR